MMLTFTGLLLEVLEGSKEMTTRIDSPNRRRIYRQFHEHSAPMDAKMWWLNPRTRSNYCMKIGTAPVRDISMRKGKDLNEAMARLDGFESLEQYLDALAYTNNLDVPAVLEQVWHLYIWNYSEIVFEEFMKIQEHPADCDRQFCPICKELEEASGFVPSGMMNEPGGLTDD